MNKVNAPQCNHMHIQGTQIKCRYCVRDEFYSGFPFYTLYRDYYIDTQSLFSELIYSLQAHLSIEYLQKVHNSAMEHNYDYANCMLVYGSGDNYEIRNFWASFTMQGIRNRVKIHEGITGFTRSGRAVLSTDGEGGA